MGEPGKAIYDQNSKRQYEHNCLGHVARQIWLPTLLWKATTKAGTHYPCLPLPTKKMKHMLARICMTLVSTEKTKCYNIIQESIKMDTAEPHTLPRTPPKKHSNSYRQKSTHSNSYRQKNTQIRTAKKTLKFVLPEKHSNSYRQKITQVHTAKKHSKLHCQKAICCQSHTRQMSNASEDM